MADLPPRLWDIKCQIEEHARAFGLDFFETIFEVVDYNTMNEIAAYGGFPTRYNHWRFGMEYEQLSKSYEYGLSKIYEMVINNDPSYAYLLEGNNWTDQKLVISHVYAHVDFFKHNYFFSKTNRRMVDQMANHATRVRRYIDRFGIEKVEDFIETCLRLDNLIDVHSQFIQRRPPRRELEEIELNEMGIPKLKSTKDYMENYINPAEYLEKQRKKVEAERERRKRVPEHPEKDVLLFLLEHAPLEAWEADILSIIREEAYYFAPQGQTKIMNEGWACILGDSIVYSGVGAITMAELVQRRIGVISDGDSARRVYDYNIIPDHPTVTVRTRRGLELTGSNNHRIMLADGESWCRLDELSVGSRIRVAGGAGLWAADEVPVEWSPSRRITLDAVAEAADVSVWTVIRHRAGRSVLAAQRVDEALSSYATDENQGVALRRNRRRGIRAPATVDARFGAFLGYLIGDGHISRVKRNLGLTTGDEPQASAFAELARELFDTTPLVRLDTNGGSSRLRVLIHNEDLSELLTDHLGLTHGPSAAEKKVPDAVLRSPKPVVAAFLRALFDCDGYAGKQGVILSTASDTLSMQVQLLLLNFGILNRRRRQNDGCWHVHVAGASAQRFADDIGFGLARKQDALADYLAAHTRFKPERWDDEIVAIEHGRADVYDISVEETHRYAAQGFVNHNSYWHSKLMTEKVLDSSEIIDYADANAGVMATSPGQLNPYKMGVELWRDIEERWNRGKFGKEFEDCDNLDVKANWNRELGLGRDKIFEVRKLYNDVTFIDEFLTEDFCVRHKLFTFAFNHKADQYEIASRKFQEIKDKLLFQLTNFGQPFVFVKDLNHENRGELLLHHKFEGTELRMDYARDVLQALHRIWRRPVNIETIIDNKGRIISFDGTEHRELPAEYEPI